MPQIDISTFMGTTEVRLTDEIGASIVLSRGLSKEAALTDANDVLRQLALETEDLLAEED